MLRAAAVQLRCGRDKAANIKKAAELVSAAASRGARLVALPEAFTGLYGTQYFAGSAERWLEAGSGTAAMSALAKEHGVYVCGGVIEACAASDKLYNTIGAFGPAGEELARYRKLHLSCVSVSADTTAEADVLTAGDGLSSFAADGWTVGLACCFDLRFKDLAAALTDPPPLGLGAGVVLYPSAWLKSTGELGHWEGLLAARALDGQCYTVGANQTRDDQQETVFYGRSVFYGPLGQQLAVIGDDTKDGVVLADLCPDELADARRRIPLRRVRGYRPESWFRDQAADAAARRPNM